MSDDLKPLRTAWASQTVEVQRFSVDELAAGATALERALRWRNRREYLAGALAIVLFGAAAWVAKDPLGRIGAGLVALGVVVVLATLSRRGSAGPIPDGAACLAWRRELLARQRDLLQGVWRWYLGPLVPGLLVMLLSGLIRAEGPADIAVWAGTVLLGACTFGWLGRLNRQAARHLQAELAALATEGDDPGV